MVGHWRWNWRSLWVGYGRNSTAVPLYDLGSFGRVPWQGRQLDLEFLQGLHRVIKAELQKVTPTDPSCPP